MVNRKLAVAALSVVVMAIFGVASTGAWDNSQQTTYVKFSRAVSLPGVELTAGTYIFELVNPANNRSLVRVLSRDRRHIYTQQFTIPVLRPDNISDSHGIVLGEAPAGAAPPVKMWFPVGETEGHEFLYRN